MMMHHHKYSLSELENMIPWERRSYIGLLVNFIKQQNEQLKLMQASKKR